MIYNPTDIFYKDPIGAVPCGKTITFRVKGNFSSVVFVYNKDGEDGESRIEMQKCQDFFVVSVIFEVGLYWYRFDLLDGRYIGADYLSYGEITNSPNSFQLSVYSKEYTVPNWLNGGIIYQIFPDRFCEGVKNKKIPPNKVYHQNKSDYPIFLPNEKGKILNNDFFGGDIQGIISKLDYIKSLGVTALYLNPIFEAYSNHRYDTGNYLKIDKILGDKNDFIELIDKANKLNVKIILDGVFNHTGDDSLYFNKYNNYQSLGAYNDYNSPYRDWFYFSNYPNEYASWWGITTLPTTNKSNLDFINYICGNNGVLEYWTKLGIGGWRLDVVDELPAFFVEKIRNSVKKANKNAIIIGEVWEDASNKISYGVRRKYFLGNELDSVMNYPLKNAIIDFVLNKDCTILSKVVREQIDRYPTFVLNALMNMLSTHDTVRILSVLANIDVTSLNKQQLSQLKLTDEQYNQAFFNLKCATILQYFLYGVPSIYYGDEVGMQGYKDPLNRCYFPWGEEDKKVYNWYKLLGEIRSMYSAFSDGKVLEVFSKKGTYIFVRKDEISELLVVVNLSNDNTTINFNGKLKDLLTNNVYDGSIDINEKFVGIFVSEN